MLPCVSRSRSTDAGAGPLRAPAVIKLYNDELSGNCYKLRLFMGLIGLP